MDFFYPKLKNNERIKMLDFDRNIKSLLSVQYHVMQFLIALYPECLLQP